LAGLGYYHVKEKSGIIVGGLAQLVVNAIVALKEPFIKWDYHLYLPIALDSIYIVICLLASVFLPLDTMAFRRKKYVQEIPANMVQLELAGNMYEVDENGFMQETDKWTEDTARAYAQLESVSELTDEHWKALNYLREYYHKNGICPMVRRLIKETGLNLSKLYQLFPKGPAQSACKWAGLPKPTGCV
jgi:TusE/DsrC/DsvC family sulfur relay protein